MEFHIYDEKMCFDRVVAFQSIASKIISSKSHSDHFEFYEKLYAESHPKDGNIIKANQTVSRLLFNAIKDVKDRGIDNIIESNNLDIYELCSQFIYTKGENMNKGVSPEHQKLKIKTWRDHCDFYCFFFLALQRLKPLVMRLRSELEQMKTTQPPSNDIS